MIKALLKKQMLEAFAWLYMNRKNGRKRSKKGLIGYGLLYIYVFGVLIALFYLLADTMCAPLSQAGFGWLYLALMSFVAIVLGIFGSVFNTYSMLYQAKDNDLLLSMPVPVSHVLLMRLFGVYVIGLMYELLVMGPTLVVWFIQGSPGVLGGIFSLIIPFILSFLILTLSCILGWVVALVSSRIKSKSFITVLLSLAFIAIYYYVYFKAYSMLTSILMNPSAVAEKVRSILYPFYHMGRAAEGNILSMLIFTAIIALVFAIMYTVLSRSFLKLATTKKGAARTRYKENQIKAESADSALLRKEWKRFAGSSNYMMNCGLGVFFMVAAAVLLMIKGDVVRQYLSLLFDTGSGEMVPMFLTAILCMLTTMNNITAPSVSLEGRNLWLVQALPVHPWQVLKAKLKLHLILTIIPAAILIASVLIVFQPAPEFMVLIPLTVLIFCLLMALLGLVLNLKAPNLTWTNEVVPIKQSMSVTLTLFGGWALILGLGILYYVLRSNMDAVIYLIMADVLLAGAVAWLVIWLKNKGSKIFSSL